MIPTTCAIGYRWQQHCNVVKRCNLCYAVATISVKWSIFGDLNPPKVQLFLGKFRNSSSLQFKVLLPSRERIIYPTFASSENHRPKSVEREGIRDGSQEGTYKWYTWSHLVTQVYAYIYIYTLVVCQPEMFFSNSWDYQTPMETRHKQTKNWFAKSMYRGEQVIVLPVFLMFRDPLFALENPPSFMATWGAERWSLVVTWTFGKTPGGRRCLSHGDGAGTFWAPQNDVLEHYQKTYWTSLARKQFSFKCSCGTNSETFA